MANDARELIFEVKELPPRDMSRLKLDEHIDVAVLTEIVPQCGPENREAGDVMPPAKGGESPPVNRDGEIHVSHHCPSSVLNRLRDMRGAQHLLAAQVRDRPR